MSLPVRIGIIVAFALGILSAPLAADAQQPKKVPRIAYLTIRSAPRTGKRRCGRGCGTWATWRARTSSLSTDLRVGRIGYPKWQPR